MEWMDDWSGVDIPLETVVTARAPVVLTILTTILTIILAIILTSMTTILTAILTAILTTILTTLLIARMSQSEPIRSKS